MTRTWLAGSGLGVLAAAWLLPLPDGLAQTFSVHMARHMAVVALAPPLLAAGIAGTRFDPARRWPSVFSPIPASILELIVVWGWHAPALHVAARTGGVAFAAEQATFLLAGCFLWMAVLGGGPADRLARAGVGVIGLLFTSMHMTLLGALFALSERPVYPHAAHGWGTLTAAQDQHLGGAIMLLVGGASYLFGGLWLMRHLLREPRIAGSEP
jgi:putative membrane protein